MNAPFYRWRNWGSYVFRATHSLTANLFSPWGPLTPHSRHFPPCWLPHSCSSVSVPGLMTPPSMPEMESPPGKNCRVWWGIFVVILTRSRVLLLEVLCSHVWPLVMGGTSEFPCQRLSSVIHLHLLNFPSCIPEHIHPVGKQEAPTTGIWFSWITQILHLEFLLVASTKIDFLDNLVFYNSCELLKNSEMQIQWCHLSSFFSQ